MWFAAQDSVFKPNCCAYRSSVTPMSSGDEETVSSSIRRSSALPRNRRRSSLLARGRPRTALSTSTGLLPLWVFFSFTPLLSIDSCFTAAFGSFAAGLGLLETSSMTTSPLLFPVLLLFLLWLEAPLGTEVGDTWYPRLRKYCTNNSSMTFSIPFFAALLSSDTIPVLAFPPGATEAGVPFDWASLHVRVLGVRGIGAFAAVTGVAACVLGVKAAAAAAAVTAAVGVRANPPLGDTVAGGVRTVTAAPALTGDAAMCALGVPGSPANDAGDATGAAGGEEAEMTAAAFPGGIFVMLMVLLGK